MKRFSLFIIVMSIIFLYSGTLHADTILYQHSGSNNPTIEGWTYLPATTGVSVGAINDGGTNAWYVDDNSTAIGSTAMYAGDVASEYIAVGNTYGWTLSTILRAVDTPDIPDGSLDIIYRDGATGWQMQIGSESDGDQIVRLRTNSVIPQTGIEYTLSGLGSSYNTYSLVYDPLAGSADLFINGIEQISDYTGYATSQTRVLWGSGTSNDTGQGNYSSVLFSVVPEPISATLFIVGGATLGFRRMRKKIMNK